MSKSSKEPCYHSTPLKEMDVVHLLFVLSLLMVRDAPIPNLAQSDSGEKLVFQFYFNFLVSGPLPVGFAQHPSPGPCTGTPSLLLPALSPSSCQCSSISYAAMTIITSLTSAVLPHLYSGFCYSCSVCTVPVGAAFLAASYCARTALKLLWFSSALLLSLPGCRVLSKYCCTVDSSTVYGSFSSATISSW